MCREYPHAHFHSHNFKGSPPHVQGIQVLDDHSDKALRLTPACAGNTRQTVQIEPLQRAHPRMCREYYILKSYHLLPLGSPPHVQGIQKTFGNEVLSYRLTPACAGNTHAFLLSALVA